MSGAKKKWAKSTKSKDKRDWSTVLLSEVAEEIEKNVPKSRVITPAKLSERYKISLTLARKILKQLEADGKIRSLMKSHTLTAYGRLEGVGDEPVEEVKKDAPAAKKGGKGGKK